MNYTENYSLPQWEDTDVVTREDVNGAMSAIDTALSGVMGGFRFVTGSFAGDGTIRRSYDIGAKPTYVFLVSGGTESYDYCWGMIAPDFGGAMRADGQCYFSHSEWTYTTDTGFYIDHMYYGYPDHSMNTVGRTMRYLALV